MAQEICRSQISWHDFEACKTMQASTWHDYSGLPVGFLAELQMNLKYEDPCVSEARHADMAQMLFQFWAQGTPVKTSTSTYVNYTGWWFGT